MYEDGYIRYDYDEKHENDDVHPLNHYDIFYSSFSTFKVGLRDRLRTEDMLDFLDSNTICHYLEQNPIGFKWKARGQLVLSMIKIRYSS